MSRKMLACLVLLLLSGTTAVGEAQTSSAEPFSEMAIALIKRCNADPTG